MCNGYGNLLLHPNREYLKKIAPQITQFLHYYSWAVNLEKSHLEPFQQFQYLGWIWNLTTMTIQLPSKKHQKVLNKLKTTKKYIQEKSNFSNNSSKINWDAFHYQNLILFCSF
jgi:hypothetical protein